MKLLKKTAAILVALGLLYGVSWAADINSLSTTDDSNIARFPENMAPSAVNDGARALEGMIARWEKDINTSLIAGGTTNSILVTPNRTISSLYSGLVLGFTATAANNSTVSLTIGALGAKEIVKQQNQSLVSGDVKVGQKVIVSYDAVNDKWQMLSSPSVVGDLLSSNNLSDVASTSAARSNLNAMQNVISAQGDLAIGDTSGAATKFGIGTSGLFLKSTGSTATWAQGGLTSISFRVFTSTGTYTKPATVSYVIVKVVGAGGGGSGTGASDSAGASGAGGGTAIKVLSAAALGSTESVTVGAGGSGGGTPGAGGNGGTSSFGSHASATGGTGGGVAGAAAGEGGSGSGGDINLTGQGGEAQSGSATNNGRNGGSSSMGGGGRGGLAGAGGGAGGNYGAGGGSSGGSASAAGGAGAGGVVIVEEYQ